MNRRTMPAPNQRKSKANTFRLVGSNVVGTFRQNDVVGYLISGTFYATAIVLDVYYYPNSTNVRLYVAGDGNSTNYDGGTGSVVDAIRSIW